MKLPLITRLPRPRHAGKLALMAAAALSLPLLMPPGAVSTASAGETRWSVTVGSSGGGGHYNRSHQRQRGYARHRDRGHYGGHHGSYSRAHHGGYSGGYSGGGYTKQVWVAPVYRTRYDDCGRAIRVCIRNGYYKQVYVRTSYQPRTRDYHRRGQWGNRGSCSY